MPSSVYLQGSTPIHIENLTGNIYIQNVPGSKPVIQIPGSKPVTEIPGSKPSPLTREEAEVNSSTTALVDYINDNNLSTRRDMVYYAEREYLVGAQMGLLAWESEMSDRIFDAKVTALLDAVANLPPVPSLPDNAPDLSQTRKYKVTISVSNGLDPRADKAGFLLFYKNYGLKVQQIVGKSHINYQTSQNREFGNSSVSFEVAEPGLEAVLLLAQDALENPALEFVPVEVSFDLVSDQAPVNQAVASIATETDKILDAIRQLETTYRIPEAGFGEAGEIAEPTSGEFFEVSVPTPEIRPISQDEFRYRGGELWGLTEAERIGLFNTLVVNYCCPRPDGTVGCVRCIDENALERLRSSADAGFYDRALTYIRSFDLTGCRNYSCNPYPLETAPSQTEAPPFDPISLCLDNGECFELVRECEIGTECCLPDGTVDTKCNEGGLDDDDDYELVDDRPPGGWIVDPVFYRPDETESGFDGLGILQG